MEAESPEEKKRKRIAIIATVVFHVLALIAFFIFGLEQPVPLPEEEGASIEFGWDEVASGDAVADISPEPVQEQVQAPTPPVEETVTETVEEVVTDEASDVAVPSQEESQPVVEETTPEEVEEEPEPEPQISDRLNNALDALSNPSGGGSQGPDDTGTGDKGNPDGTKGQGALGQGNGSWQLDGRSMLPGYGTKISTTREEGVVVLKIWVDRNGNVTKVQPDLKESNTTSQYLINLAKNDVLNNFKFNGDPSAMVEQRGKVRYVFQLK